MESTPANLPQRLRAFHALAKDRPALAVVAPIMEAAGEIERLRIELAQALRQWRMYAEMNEDRDLKTEQTPEAEMYRLALALTHQ